MNLSELKDLDFNNAGSWPPLVKGLAMALIMAAVGFAGYWFIIKDQITELEKVRKTEQELRRQFKKEYKVMANLDAYRVQLAEMQKLLDTMLRQLPTRTEMPDLLEDISNEGKRNGMKFELFKPEQEQPKEFYAAKPISIKATATYHQLGAFVSSISSLSRIVTVENIKVATPQTRGQENNSNEPLQIEATLQTYRYLDDDEIEQTAQENASKRKR